MAEVKFKFIGDDSELRKKLANLSKIQSEMTDKFSEDLNKALSNSKSQVFKDITKDAANAAIQTDRLNKIAANKAIVNAKIDQIDSIRRLREERSKEISNLITLKQIESEARTVLAEKKLITESLTQSEKALHNEYLKTGKDLNVYTLKLKEQAEERRKANQVEREAEKALKASEKARKDVEREAAKNEKETAKRKKQLEQESSEYYKLNKALGAVRKEAKDVLAEMFRMERQGHANTLGYEALRKKSEGLTKQTQYLDQGIKKIDASLGLHQRNVGNYGSAIELLGPQFESINQKLSFFGTSIDDLAGKPNAFKELGIAVSGFGKSILSFILSPVGLAISALAGLFALFQSNKQTVIDFDAGLKNVSKTTNITGQDLNNFGDAIVQLSRKLQVVDSSKLLEYATIAGQLGIKGTNDILAFTEALAMLETASDISGEQGGREIARMLTLVDGGVQNVKAFGDEIVNLGNNFAATEKEILSNAEQIAQNVGIYKIGRQDILAFATATKAVGLEAELVGSTFSRTLGEFEKSIRSGKGVNDLLKIIGGTSQELSKRFRDDAAGVFVDYIKGLNGINKAGGSVNEALERTGIIAVRDQRVIASLASNGYDVLTGALENVKTAQGAMQAEFENGSSKIEQQSKRVGIAWDNLVLSIENGSGVIGKSSVAIVGFLADIIDSAGNAESRLNKLFASKFFSEEFWLRVSSLSTAPIEYFLGTNATGEEADRVRAETAERKRNGSGRSSSYNQNIDFGKSDYNYYNRKASTEVIASDVVPIDLGESEAERKKADAANSKARQAREKAQQEAKKLIEDQRQAQARIDEMNEQARRKALSKEDQDILSIQDKYKKAWEQIAKDREKGLKVNTSGLKEAEQAEVAQYYADIESKKQEEIKKKQEDALKNMLQLSATNESQIADIRKKYSDAYELLEANKTKYTLEEFEKRKEALKKGQTEEISAVLLPEVKQGQDWVNVFDKSAKLARTKVQESVESLRTSLKQMLDGGKITIEQYNDALKQISDVEIQVQVSERGLGRIKQVLKELKDAEKGSVKYDQARQKLAGEINSWGQGLVAAGGEALNIADQLGIGSDKFKEDMALSLDLAGNAVNLASSIASGDVVGMVTNGIKTISSAINLFTKDRGIERKIQEYQKQLESLVDTYESLAKKMSDSDANYYNNSDALLKNLDDQEKKIKQMMDAEDDKKKTDKDKMKSYQDQLKGVQTAREELEKSIREMRLQTDINSLAKTITDALVGAFEAGEDGIHAMDDAFDKFIKNSLANSARLKFVQDLIDSMMKDLDGYMSKNDNSLVGYDFTQFKQKLDTANKQVFDFLESAYSGLGLTKDGQSSSSLKAEEGIQRLTEETGTEIVGMYRAGYDIWKRQLIALDVINSNSANHLRIATDKLTALNAIQVNTANTVARLDSAVTELKGIRQALR